MSWLFSVILSLSDSSDSSFSLSVYQLNLLCPGGDDLAEHQDQMSYDEQGNVELDRRAPATQAQTGSQQGQSFLQGKGLF